MADPTNYFFNDPQFIHFPQNEFYTRGLWAEAVSYYLPPGVNGTLQLFSLGDKVDRLPSINSEPDWGKQGHDATVKGVAYFNYDTGPGGGFGDEWNPPWNPSYPESIWERPEISDFLEDPSGYSAGGINGSWKQNRNYLSSFTFQSVGGTAGNYRAVAGTEVLNTYLRLVDLWQTLVAPRLPLAGSPALPITGSGCVSAAENGLNAIISVRLTLPGPPFSGGLGSRGSVPAQVFHAGWVAFGHS